MNPLSVIPDKRSTMRADPESRHQHERSETRLKEDAAAP
jgi:hypothetical protein